jgi:hypothetical protein
MFLRHNTIQFIIRQLIMFQPFFKNLAALFRAAFLFFYTYHIYISTISHLCDTYITCVSYLHHMSIIGTSHVYHTCLLHFYICPYTYTIHTHTVPITVFITIPLHVPYIYQQPVA